MVFVITRSVVMICVLLRCASLAVSADAGVNTDVLLMCVVLWKCVFSMGLIMLALIFDKDYAVLACGC